ncbi:hypothetical protein Zmor_015663 [Zophobas morio]|uniref:Reverse transcriptase domain-containing protein n=1 Tax=Zophobas morio TaxID=2755281 RepID=A0AA38IHF3_9CUCU|nr:hypothetical protein Zmor_015663 [Zophobas morio]
MPSSSKKRAFADDTQLMLHFQPSLVEDACNDVNKDLVNIVKAASSINLKLNADKSKLMCFAPKKLRMAIANNIDIRIGNKKLPVLQTVKN